MQIFKMKSDCDKDLNKKNGANGQRENRTLDFRSRQ